MRDSPPMAEELRNGFYPDFETGWRRAEIVGRVAMLLVVAATLAGLLGGGPATLWTSQVAAGALRVAFPRRSSASGRRPASPSMWRPGATRPPWRSPCRPPS